MSCLRGNRVDTPSKWSVRPFGVRPPDHARLYQSLGDTVHDRLASLSSMRSAVYPTRLPPSGPAFPLPEKLGDVRACGPPGQLCEYHAADPGLLWLSHLRSRCAWLQAAAVRVLR